jgi:hypothetical protein
VREEALEHGGAEAGPNQPGGDMRIGRVELVQVRVRLPFFEIEFDPPPEAMEPADEARRERSASQVRAEAGRREGLGARAQLENPAIGRSGLQSMYVGLMQRGVRDWIVWRKRN